MKTRNTVFLLALVALLVGYLYFVEKGTKTTSEQLKSSSKVVEFDRDTVDTISIHNPETEIELHKQASGKWVLEKPVKDRADASLVAELLTTAESLKSDAAIDLETKSKEQLKEYGISDSNTKVKFIGGGKTVSLTIGKDAAVEGKNYAFLEGADKVHAIDRSLKNQLSKKGDDFRDHKLADIGAQQVTKAEIKTGAGVLELVKKNNHWSISKPLQARGDDSKINDLIAQALTAHVERFVPEAEQVNSGLSDPRATMTLSIEGADKPLVLELGATKEAEKKDAEKAPAADKSTDNQRTFARLSSRDAVVLVPKAIEKIIETRPNDLRDRNLIRVESDIVDRITVEPEGGGRFVMGRKGESWVQKAEKKIGDKTETEDQPINETVPQNILANLQGTQVLDFVADVADELPQYGLDHPRLKVTLSSFASGNTAETNAGDKPIVSILFGQAAEGKVYAKVDDEPFIVTVPFSVIAGMPNNALQLQPLAIFNDKPEQVTAFEVTRPAQGVMGLEKDKDGKWKLTKGDGTVIQANAQAIADKMATLTAIRWVGPARSEDGFDKPTVAVSATVSQGDKMVAHKLIVGFGGGDFWNATVEGREGVFELGKVDHDTMIKPLTEQAAASSPAPGSAGTPAPQPMPPAPGANGSPAPSDTNSSPTGAPTGPGSPATPAAPIPFVAPLDPKPGEANPLAPTAPQSPAPAPPAKLPAPAPAPEPKP